LIRNENVSITVNSTAIYPQSVSITSGVGRGYNTCNISGTSLSGSVNDMVIVTINGEAHTFILDEKHYGKSEKVSFVCKGLPIILEDYSAEDVVYSYTSSTDLIDSEITRANTTIAGTISVVNNIPLIEFGNQSYSKDSTPMSRILDMVSVVGGEAYETNGTLNLDLAKIISTNPTIKYSYDTNIGDVMDYSFFEKRDKSLKAKYIHINPIIEAVYTTPLVTLDFDESWGHVYFNPSLPSTFEYSITGLSTTNIPVPKTVVEKFQLNGESSITTMGGIDAVSSISARSINLDEFDPLAVSNTDTEYVRYDKYNVISFTQPIVGEVIITYDTLAVKVFATQSTDFEIIYQCSRIADLIIIDADNTVNAGSCYGKIIEPLTFENSSFVEIIAGADVELLFVEARGATNKVTVGTYSLIGGGTLTTSYLHSGTPWVSTAFMTTITSATDIQTEVIEDTITYDSLLNKWVVYLDKPLTTINDIYFGSSALSGYTYNAGTTLPYISFLEEDVGKLVDISFDSAFDRLTIQAPSVGHPVSLLDMIVCQGVGTSEYIPAEEALCSLPSTFKVDVAGSFNKSITEVRGRVLTGDFGTLVVDNYGKVEITVTTQATQTILCDSIFTGSFITIDSNGVV